MDYDAAPFNLPLPLYRLNRFYYCRDLHDETPGSCYPFHAACLSLLLENNSGKLLDRDVRTLFNIFKSVHFDKGACALSWGHNYYFIDILNLWSSENDVRYFRGGIVAASKAKLAILANLLYFNFYKEVWNREQSLPKADTLFLKRASYTSLAVIKSLSPKILQLVLYSLTFCNTQHLLSASAVLYMRYRQSPCNLPKWF